MTLTEFRFALPAQDVNVICAALEELPIKAAKGTYDRFTSQVIEQQRANAEAQAFKQKVPVQEKVLAQEKIPARESTKEA